VQATALSECNRLESEAAAARTAHIRALDHYIRISMTIMIYL